MIRVNTGKFVLWFTEYAPAMGHMFNEDMTCRCGVSFQEHQHVNRVCAEKAKNDRIRKVKHG